MLFFYFCFHFSLLLTGVLLEVTINIKEQKTYCKSFLNLGDWIQGVLNAFSHTSSTKSLITTLYLLLFFNSTVFIKEKSTNCIYMFYELK